MKKTGINWNESGIFAGIAGGVLDCGEYDFGEGISLRETFAHVFQAPMVAFAPAKPGQHHPAPWAAVSTGRGRDVLIELAIPETFKRKNWFDRINTVWVFVSLLRLRTGLPLQVLVISDHSLSAGTEKHNVAHYQKMEEGLSRFVFLEKGRKREITEDDLDWVGGHWIKMGDLFLKDQKFRIAYQSIDQTHDVRFSPLYFLSLWIGLEAIFSPSDGELRFRLSSMIASYLRELGKNRQELQRRIKKLYDARSGVVHGSSDVSIKDIRETYFLLREVIMKIIEEGKAPTEEMLATRLFIG